MTSTLPTPITTLTLGASAAVKAPISEQIRQRLIDADVPFLANDNISAYLRDGELDQLENEVAIKVRELLRRAPVHVLHV